MLNSVSTSSESLNLRVILGTPDSPQGEEYTHTHTRVCVCGYTLGSKIVILFVYEINLYMKDY